MKQKHVNIPIFLPELACKNKCVFCNQKQITTTQNIPSIQDIINKIELHLSTIDTNTKVQIAFFGGNFTGLPFKMQESYLQAAYRFIEQGKVESIRISTRPDYITENNLLLLKSFGVKDIELGAQSFDPEVLRLSKRNHSVEDIRTASCMIREHGFSLGLQMMIGLPGDTYVKAMHTAQSIIDCKANTSRIYPCLVIAHTELANMHKQNQYIPLDLQTAVAWSADIYSLLQKHEIQVLRVGLHPNADFESPEVCIAGPYHQSFKQLVCSEIWKQRFLKHISVQKGKLHIEVAPSEIAYAVGYKSSNKTYLRSKFGWISIRANTTLQNNEFTYSII